MFRTCRGKIHPDALGPGEDRGAQEFAVLRARSFLDDGVLGLPNWLAPTCCRHGLRRLKVRCGLGELAARRGWLDICATGVDREMS